MSYYHYYKCLAPRDYSFLVGALRGNVISFKTLQAFDATSPSCRTTREFSLRRDLFHNWRGCASPHSPFEIIPIFHMRVMKATSLINKGGSPIHDMPLEAKVKCLRVFGTQKRLKPRCENNKEIKLQSIRIYDRAPKGGHMRVQALVGAPLLETTKSFVVQVKCRQTLETSIVMYGSRGQVSFETRLGTLKTNTAPQSTSGAWSLFLSTTLLSAENQNPSIFFPCMP
ncbi:hypothetical protein VNO78_05489 [Psophocarpus tetragonolobus]|uniref:Uncharacterized protein n=1 Tax=Psophocarpus tetragonolobus TaxID=3891 RepID=A0AAN9SSA9_PSOTE